MKRRAWTYKYNSRSSWCYTIWRRRKRIGFKWINKESDIYEYPIVFDVDLEKIFDNFKEW